MSADLVRRSPAQRDEGGGGGIRTHVSILSARRFSKPVPWTGLDDTSFVRCSFSESGLFVELE